MNEAYQGTLIEEIDAIVTSGNFSQTESAPPPEADDLLLGECTDLEKAVFTLFLNKAKEIATIHQALSELCKDGSQAAHERKNKLESQVNVLRRMFWQLIMDRLNEPNAEMSIREGFRIVELSKQAAERLHHRGSRIQIIGLGGSGLAKLLDLE